MIYNMQETKSRSHFRKMLQWNIFLTLKFESLDAKDWDRVVKKKKN